MKVLLDIQDNKAVFFMEVLKNFSFVKAQPIKSDVPNDDFEDYMMLEIMRNRKSDDRITLDEFKTLVGWK